MTPVIQGVVNELWKRSDVLLCGITASVAAETTATQTLMGLLGLGWTCGMMLRNVTYELKPLQNLGVTTTRSSIGR